MAKKKYQVFVSSTYTDLKNERMAVMQCLLDNDCIPVGMEQFAASNMSQMEYIKRMLDDCDYYILILAGRYGSLDRDGIGFTEKEYDYALSKKIPIMSFLHDNIENLPVAAFERDEEGKKRLLAFRDKVSREKMVKFYANIGDLKAAVVTSINKCKQDYPAVGWVRGKKQTYDESENQTAFFSCEIGGIHANLQAETLHQQIKPYSYSPVKIENIDNLSEMSLKISELEKEIAQRPKIHIGDTAPSDINALWIDTSKK